MRINKDTFQRFCKDGKHAKMFRVGDEIEIFSKETRTTVFRVKVLGINHDVDANGNIIPLTVAPLEMPGRKAMHEYWGDSKGDYSKTDVRKFLNNYYNALPDEVKSLIIPAVKKTKTYDGKEVTTTDNVFIPSEFEVFGRVKYSDRVDDDKQYPAFKTWRGRVQSVEGEDYAGWYWLRSPRSGSGSSFCVVSSSGSYSYNYASYTCAVLPCFCIGVSE